MPSARRAGAPPRRWRAAAVLLSACAVLLVGGGPRGARQLRARVHDAWLDAVRGGGGAGGRAVCDTAAFLAARASAEPTLQTLSAGCRAELRQLVQKQFGPPTDWEMYNGMCKTVCSQLTKAVAETNKAGGCTCQPFDQTGVIPHTPMTCNRTSADYLCKIVQVCWTQTRWDRLMCTGCGSDQHDESNWRLARAYSYCGAAGLGPSAALAGALALVAAAAGVARVQ